jgi:uncharacterized protein YegJ (DUF2314 family)
MSPRVSMAAAVALVLSTSAAGAAPQPVPTGSLLAPDFSYVLAVYHLPRPKGDPVKVATSLAAKQALKTSRAPLDRPPRVPTVAVMSVPSAEAPAIDSSALQHFGRGLSNAQLTALAASERVTVLEFSGPGSSALATYRKALALATAVARESGGLVWDDEARFMFSPEAWSQRETGWSPDGLPDVAAQLAIHAYRDGELLRIITLGMRKFALPDVVVNQVPSGRVQMEALVNLLCQRLVEGARLEKPGQLTLSLDEVRHATVRGDVIKSLLPEARRRTVLHLGIGRRDEGDPENRLVEILFPGTAPQVAQVASIAELFGKKDSLIGARHDKELLAASERARRKALALKPRYAKTPPLNERLSVKAPFKTKDGGNEWMWVEVVRWEGSTIKGILQNDPYEVPNLKAGARVDVDEKTIFDYILSKPDGTQEGNETGALIEKSQ